MRLRNKHGRPVDPVPFLVVVVGTLTVSYSYGPLYLMALGLALEEALLACGAVVALVAGGAHHRMVWTARPELRGEVPSALRIKRLFYAAFIGVALLLLLALPLFVR